MLYIKRRKLIFVYSVRNKLRVTYEFVGNPGFVGNSIVLHPKYDERNVILQHSRFKWKFYNAVLQQKPDLDMYSFVIQSWCAFWQKNDMLLKGEA